MTIQVDDAVDFRALTDAQLYDLLHGTLEELQNRAAEEPTQDLLEQSLQLEAAFREAATLQYRYAGLLKDAFETSAFRAYLQLPEGKTAFRDAKDFIAKTHGIRANEASARLRLAAAIAPVRATDPQRSEHEPIGQARLPILAAYQGQVNPTKLSSALSMLDELEQNAEAAGKDQDFRTKLRTLVEKDFAEKIEGTTPEEFSRYVSQRKRDLLASLDPPDKQFSSRQTDAMHNVRRIGPVRGNANAIEYSVIFDAEGDEIAQTLLATLTNPRGKGDADARSGGQRRMHALRDVLKFALANLDKTGFRGASGAHAQMLVVTDYATLLDGIRKDLAQLLPDIHEDRRARLLEMLAEIHAPPGDVVPPAGVSTTAKTTEVLLGSKNLDRLQPRISQGIYAKYIPPDVMLRMHCDIGVTPITLTGQRQVLSIGRQQRQFSESLRRAILARDRGCAAPGCHVVASLCELHHIEYWSRGGETSTDNGITLCSHHHKAVHVGQLTITRVDGEHRFVMHPLIDPTQRPRKNYFFQS
ncbi:MAG TPA: HNH endonuclease [Candidatus Yaniella excrementigallinarum]|nr:HNH endonuclease [Candidatus Yaniella excrementigallinarum]